MLISAGENTLFYLWSYSSATDLKKNIIKLFSK